MSDGLIDRIDWDKGAGLVALIVQHAHDGRVLMLGYADREALAATLASGQVHFHSRSRGRLWKKGETSGHVLNLVSLALDCDRDSVLCQALPAGPTCHTGAASCFDRDGDAHPWLNRLEALIDTRRGADPETSYVAGLFAHGTKRQAQKVGEEGLETALAAVAGDRDELRAEAADLVFHLLVLLRAGGLTLADVVGELAARHRLR